MSGIRMDGLDRALIDALGIAPRASWEALGGVLGADSGTLARRWRRLTASGAARIVVEPGAALALHVAVVEIECAPSALPRAAARLSEEDAVMAWHTTSGARDIVAVAGAAHREDISQLVVSGLVDQPGVRAARVAFADSRVHGGSDGYGVLLPGQVAELARIARPVGATVDVDEQVERAIRATLAADPRASWRELAEATDLSPHRVRSALASLLARERFQLRVRLAASVWGDSVTAWLFAKAEPHRISAAVERLGEDPRARFVAAVHGRYDLIVCIRLPDLDAVAAFIDAAARSIPGIRFIDRSIVLDQAAPDR